MKGGLGRRGKKMRMIKSYKLAVTNTVMGTESTAEATVNNTATTMDRCRWAPEIAW